MAEKMYETVRDWADIPANSLFTFNSEAAGERMRESHAAALRKGTIIFVTDDPKRIMKERRMAESRAWEEAQEDGLK